MTPRVYTTAQVCAMLLISRTIVSEMVKAGVLKSPSRGKITIRSFDEFLEDGRSWQEIAKEIAAAKKAKGPNGKTKRRSTGGGGSGKTAKVTPFQTLIDRGRLGNVLNSAPNSKKE